ncbi:hypothetical protein BASA81_008609 [Batrachochytrium salamandrivorans]|nr:hypothetical protein BASA81_008609 [Batrachochytrium salamandrivorans]
MLGTLLTGNALSWYNPVPGENRISFNTNLLLGPRFKGKLTADIEWNDAALRSQFYHGLSSEIKDALVHFDNPATVSTAMDMAIRIDNRLFERRQEQRIYHQRPSSSYYLATPVTSRFRNQQQQPRIVEPRQTANPIQPNSFINLSSARPTQKSDNHMDIDFVRRGPLSFMERKHRMKQELCLVCGEVGHRKVTCPKSRFKFNSDSIQKYPRYPDRIHETDKTLGNRFNLSFKETVKFSQTASNFDTLNMDMMKLLMVGFMSVMESDDVARGVLGRLENMVLAPRELADRLNIPLVKIPVPIKLRLADGDSSSMITHRTLPSSCILGDMLRQLVSMSLVSAMGLFSGLGKPPRTSDISPKPDIPEQEPFDQTSDSAVDLNIDASLFKDPSMDLDLGIKKPVLRNTNGASKSVSFAETIQTEVYLGSIPSL